jgi:hypothetical protein
VVVEPAGAPAAKGKTTAFKRNVLSGDLHHLRCNLCRLERGVGGDPREHGRVSVTLAHRARIQRCAAARIDRDACTLPAAAIEADGGEPTRGRHAAHLGVGGDANATITPGRAQTLLLRAAAGTVEGRESLVETTLVIAAVIDHGPAAVRAIRKIGWRDEIDPPHHNRIETEMAGHRFDRPFGNVGGLWASIAAIRVDRHRIGRTTFATVSKFSML